MKIKSLLSVGILITLGLFLGGQVLHVQAATCTIIFDSQNATVPASPAIITVLPPATTVGTLPTVPTKTGYIFGGWYNTPNGVAGGGTKFTATTSVLYSGSGTVYANWTTDPNSWSTNEANNIVWGPENNITNAQSTTDGASNTATLVALGNYPAANYCHNLTEGGHSDWYLPAIEQLSLGMYDHDFSVTGSDGYWSSTDYSKSTAIYFKNSIVTNLKSNGARVRCFRASTTPSPTTLETTTFATPLKLGMSSADVKQLEVFLNSSKTGCPGNTCHVSTIGAGSPGKETNAFGLKTYNAVKKFQEYYKSELLTPSNLTKGTGFVGTATLNKINSLMSSQ